MSDLVLKMITNNESIQRFFGVQQHHNEMIDKKTPGMHG